MLNYNELRQEYKTERNRMPFKCVLKPSRVIFIALLGISLLTAFFMAGCALASEVDMSIISTIESSNIADAYNKKSGAIGLCQITPVVLKEFNLAYGTKHKLKELYGAQFNLLVGDWYINHKIPAYLKHYRIKDTIENRIRAYNSGIGTLKKGIYPQETRDYVRKYNKLTRGK